MVFLERPRVMFFSTEMERGMGGGFERDFARKEMGMSRSFGEPLGRGMGKKAPCGQGLSPHCPGAGSPWCWGFFLRQSLLVFLRLLKNCMFSRPR